VIDKCRKRYDLVLIDSPPLLQITDARVVGRLTDAVILVARADKTTRDAIIGANQRLSADRIRVLGTILNDWNPRRSSHGYYGYGYGYGYGYQKYAYGYNNGQATTASKN
jgi:Mrp family chromosome partitioning ATPase